MNDASLKPSKKVKIGEVYVIKRDIQVLEIEITKIIDKRLSAPLAQECYKEISNIIKTIDKQPSSFFNPNIYREKGLGRPTKKERRAIDEFEEDDII
jgi:ribosome-associated heat shock protein Hsp15